MKPGSLRISSALSVEQFGRLLVHAYRAGRYGRYTPILVWGESGIGKSETVARVAKNLGVGFKDLRLGLFEAPDLIGTFRQQEVFPCFLDFTEGGDPRRKGRLYTRYALYATLVDRFPQQVSENRLEGPDQIVEWAIESAKKADLGHLFQIRTVNSPPSWLPQPGTTGFLFLDEINRAPREVKQGSFQLVLDRQIGQIPLPEGWIVISAANPPDVEGHGMGYGMVDTNQDAAFLSRFCNIRLEPSVEEWLSWARGAQIDPRVRAFVSKHGLHFLGSSRVVKGWDPDPTPRSWVMLSKLVSPLPPEVPGGPQIYLDEDLVSAVATGLVGIEATRTWFAMRMVPDPLVEARDLASDYASAYARLRRFLSYPTIDPTTGQPNTDQHGNVLETCRSDLVSFTFESMTDALRDNATAERAPGDKWGDAKLLVTALRLVDDARKDVADGGLGMDDIATQRFRMWVGPKAMVKGRALLPMQILLSPDPSVRQIFAELQVDPKSVLQRLQQSAVLQGYKFTATK